MLIKAKSKWILQVHRRHSHPEKRMEREIQSKEKKVEEKRHI